MILLLLREKLLVSASRNQGVLSVFHGDIVSKCAFLVFVYAEICYFRRAAAETRLGQGWRFSSVAMFCKVVVAMFSRA